MNHQESVGKSTKTHTCVVAPTISGRAGSLPRSSGRFSFFLDAFRPFYLGGAIVAAMAVPLWLGMWHFQTFTPSLSPLFWHTHEMVFGFGVAIIVGFLFTAARNWTGLPLPTGVPLALLAGLWVAGRAGLFFGYGPITAFVDSSLLIIVAGVLARKFVVARSWGNMPLVIVLSLLASANIAFHMSTHNLISVSPLHAVEAGLFFIVLIEMIVGGRVVPGFSASALRGAWQWRSQWLHRGSLAIAAIALICDLLSAPASLTGTLSLGAGVAVAIQALGWNPLAARINPMLWILHAAYGFIPVGLVLLGLAAFGIVPRSAGIHALGVGSMGGLIIGMITRTALGHSERVVRAGRAEIAAFTLILLAAVLRVIAALIPGMYVGGMFAAGTAWTAAFVVYVAAYGPMLFGKKSPGDQAPVSINVQPSLRVQP